MGMRPAPCKFCFDRPLGCHGLCKDYNDWVLERNEYLKCEKATMPKPIYKGDFVGTTPPPGVHRFTRRR